MGCKSSKDMDQQTSNAAAPTSGPTNAATQKPAEKGEEKPRPLVFALMRNAHEVIRGAMVECNQQLDNDNLEGFKECWENLKKFEEMHMHMEEGLTDVAPGFFSILNDHFDGLAKKEGLHDAHPKVEAAEHKVAEVLSSADLAAVKLAFKEFQAANDPHLKHEEDVMMPKVMALKQSGVNLKQEMATKILPAALAGDFKFFVTFAMTTLEKHSGGMPRARVFAHALWGVATDTQWDTWEPWVKEGLSDSLFAEMAPLFARDAAN